MVEPVIIGNATLYCGDCMEILPTLDKVDAVVTDPPYGVRERSGTTGKKRKRFHDYISHNDTEDFVQNMAAPLIKYCVDKFGRVAITTGTKNVWFYDRPDSIGAFYQPAATSLQKWGFFELDLILFYGRDPRVGKTISKCTYIQTEAPAHNGHPCPRPIKAWQWLVHKTSLDNETVLDPFMGSGTTGVACMNLDRKFIGIEIDPKYFDIACKRIEAAQQQLKLF